MADRLISKIMFTLNYSALETIMSEFVDVDVEKDGIHIITRGFGLHELLKEITKENFLDVIIAKHSSSQDMYSTVYTVQYRHGTSETLGIETSEPIIREINQDEAAELLRDLEEQELNVNKICINKKEVNKELIPSLLKESESQRPQKDLGPRLRSGKENFDIEISVVAMAAEDVERGYDKKINIAWILDYLYELEYGPIEEEDLDNYCIRNYYGIGND